MRVEGPSANRPIAVLQFAAQAWRPCACSDQSSTSETKTSPGIWIPVGSKTHSCDPGRLLQYVSMTSRMRAAQSALNLASGSVLWHHRNQHSSGFRAV